MTTSDGKYPGYYTLKSAYLSSEFDNKTYREISGLIPKIQINESMKNDCIRGSASVVDAVGLLEEWPLRGEELLVLTLEDALGNETEFNMFIYKVDNVKYDNENNVITYTIHFVSRQRYNAGLKKIIKSYEKPASEIVKDIFGEFLRREARPSDQFGAPGLSVLDLSQTGEFKSLVVEDTEGTLKCIIPNFTPMQAYRFLCERSQSPKFNSASYRFFERTDAYYFVTDEYMMEKSVKENKVFEFTSAAIPRSGEFFREEMNNLIELSSPNKVNSINDLTDGAYKSQAIVLDILYGVANIKQNKKIYDYKAEDYYSYPDETQTDKHTDKWINASLNEDNCRKFLIVKDYDDKNGGVLPGNKFYPDIVLNRNAYMKQQENVVVSAVGHGRFDITCGDVVNLKLPRANSTDQKGPNKHLTGRYLVHEVVRTFDRDIAQNMYTLVKREWAEADDV